MKRKLRLFGCICIIFLGCTKDFDGKILDTFDFSFTGNNDASGYVYEQLSTSFVVNPEKQVEDSRFSFSYIVKEGDGHFEDADGNIYAGGEIELGKLNFEYTYVPTEIGTHTVVAKATDHRDNSKEVELVYEVDYAPFTAILESGTNKFIVNKDNDLLLIMVSENTSEALKNNYKIRYSIDGGIGALKLGDEILEAGKEIVMEKGSTELSYLPTTLGTHTITMICTSPDGFERTVTLEMGVENVTFFLTADPVNPAAPVGEDMDIDITLETTDLGDEIDYEIVYYFADESDGVGSISNASGEIVESATEYPIEPGGYTYSFNSDVIGRKKIYFDVSDSNNQIKRDSVEFDYSTVPFRFSGSALNTDVALNQNVPLNFTLSNDGAPEGITYQYAFRIPKGSGVLRTPDGETVGPATSVQVLPGNFSLSYTPQTLGETELEFIVTDSFGQDSEQVTILLNVGDTFGFSVVSDKNTYQLSENATLTMNVSGQGSYTATYVSTNEGVLTYNNTSYAPGSSFPIGSGTGLASYQSFGTGTHELSFTIVSDSGASRPGTVSFDFEEDTGGNEATFTADAARSSADIDESVAINFDLQGEGAFTTTYGSSNTGNFTYGGNTVEPGQVFTMVSGTSQGSYTGRSSGDHTLTFDITSDTGASLSDSALITYSATTGTGLVFTATASASSADTGDNVNIALDVEGNGTYTATYTTSNTGVFVYNGANIVPGASFEVPSGASQGIYNGTDEGIHNIDFSISSDTGESATDGTNITYGTTLDDSITFITTEASGTATVGSTVAIDFVLDGNESYTATYTNSSSGSFSYNGATIAPGQSFSIATGDSSGNYSGSVSGVHNLDFRVVSNSGASATDAANIAYEDAVDTAISFSVDAASDTADIGNGVTIDLDLEGDETYTANYSTSNTGSFSYNGNTISPGQSFPISTGNSAGSYLGGSAGIHNINFSVTSDSNATATDGTSITYNAPVDDSLTFSADPVSGSGDIGEDVDITFSLAGLETYSATYTNSSTGSFTYNGSDVAPGVPFAIGSGASTGTYTGEAEGVHSLDFSVSSDTGTTASDGATITFGIANVPVTGVSVSPATAAVTEGQNTSLTAEVTPSNASDSSVSWSSNDTSIATVDNSGTVSAVSAGTATVTVTTNDGGFTATADISVNVATISVTGISLSPTTATVTEGQSTSLTSNVTPSNASDRSISWSSSNTAVATVNGSGKVSGGSAGTATITAITNDGGFTATANIIVQAATVPVTGVSVNPTSASVTEGQNTTLNVNVTPSNASDRSVSWSSSNTSVATVNSSGVVTGVSSGTATITVTTNDGNRTATSNITVQAATVSVTGVSVSPATISIDEGQSTTLTANVTPSNATDRSVNWTSSNASIATVNNSGVVTGVSEGTAIITVTTSDGGFTATVSITVNAPIDTTITFSANAAPNSADVGDAVNINLSLQGNETYTATYSTSNTGTLSYGGNTISPGESFDIRTGGSTAVYRGNASGNHTISFSITSNTNVTVSDSTDIAYNSEPTSTIVVNNWPIFETEQIGAGGTGRGPLYENANISTGFSFTPLSIRAEIIEQIPSNAPENEILRFLDVRIGDRFGQNFLDQTITIPNGTNFTIYMQKPGDRVAGLEYQGASTTIRFFISNSVETITRDVTFTQIN